MSIETRYETPPVDAPEVVEHPSRRRGRPARTVWVTAVVALLVGLAGGYLLRWGTAPTSVPQAVQVGRQFAGVMAASSPSTQHEDAQKLAALFAPDAVATDMPTGEQARGRASIQDGAQTVFAQGGTWKVDHVLGDDRWAMVLLTWTGTGRGGHTVSTPYVALLEVRDGLIVSDSDIYDDPFGWDK